MQIANGLALLLDLVGLFALQTSGELLGLGRGQLCAQPQQGRCTEQGQTNSELGCRHRVSK